MCTPNINVLLDVHWVPSGIVYTTSKDNILWVQIMSGNFRHGAGEQTTQFSPETKRILMLMVSTPQTLRTKLKFI